MRKAVIFTTALSVLIATPAFAYSTSGIKTDHPEFDGRASVG